MRLIDKDVLLVVMSAHCAMCKKRSDYYPSKCRNCDLDDGIDVVECFETVEAIPVDWLLEFETIQNENQNPLFREIDVIREAVYEWRKENADN